MIAGIMLTTLGRFDEAIPVYEYVADRDPVYVVNLMNLQAACYDAGR